MLYHIPGRSRAPRAAPLATEPRLAVESLSTSRDVQFQKLNIFLKLLHMDMGLSESALHKLG